MTQNKQLLAATTVLIICAGFWGWQYLSKPSSGKNAAFQQKSSLLDTESSSLSVSQNGSSINLGQIPREGLEGNQRDSDNTVNSSATNTEINPTMFKEYEKYKDQDTALFGEISKGDGAEIAANNKAAIVYRGWLTDGTLFDSSPKGADGKYQAMSFTVGANEVIPGLEQGLGGMKVGGKRLIIIPPAVGYGASGHNNVPPNAVMVFEIALVGIQ
jgi:FKBP-type peptidyl-prolyl cis-trans isomerase FkpA